MSLNFKLNYQPAFFACLTLLTGMIVPIEVVNFELSEKNLRYGIISMLVLTAIFFVLGYRAKLKL